MSLTLQYPLGSYSDSNKPSNITLMSDLSSIQTTVNANETSMATKTGVETLTNKTLTSPVITNKTSTGTDSGSETLTNKTLTSPVINTIRSWDGWEDANETPTYSSVDTATGVITVASGAKTKFPLGSRVKFNQSQALSAYWSFDTDSTEAIGAYANTPTSVTYTAGKFSNAATFNGTTSKIVVTDNAVFKPTGEFTIGCWFKTSTTGTNRVLFQSFSKNTSLAGIYLNIASTNVLQFVSGKNTGTTSGTDFSTFNGPTTVTDNVFHYVVISFRNNFVQVYLDGRIEISGYCLTPTYAATNYVRIGCYNETGTDSLFTNGQIDDLFIINGYALDEETIRTKYDLGTAQGTGNITVTKMGLVHDRTDTTLTLYTGTDYTLANSAITSFYWSPMKCPLGFTTSPSKWTVEFSHSSQASQSSPTAQTWYNVGSISTVIPIGLWNTSYQATFQVNLTSAVDEIFSTLSSSSSSETDIGFTASADGNGATIAMFVHKQKMLLLRAKTTYYLNVKHSQSTSGVTMYTRSDNNTTFIRSLSVYL